MPAINVRVPEELTTEIDARTEPGDRSQGRSAAIRDGLDRYYGMLARARLSLRKILTTEEVSLIADASNGTMYETWSIPMLAAGVDDAIELDGLDQKWQVDGPVLIQKLSSLGLAETFALVDAVERFWAAASRGEEAPLEDILRDKVRDSDGVGRRTPGLHAGSGHISEDFNAPMELRDAPMERAEER